MPVARHEAAALGTVYVVVALLTIQRGKHEALHEGEAEKCRKGHANGS